MARRSIAVATVTLSLLAAPLACQVLEAKAPTTAGTEKYHFEDAADYSAERAGLCMLAYHHGKLVFERYEAGHTADRTQHIFSGTKSFVPMVALVAQHEGLLQLDEPVSKTITEWREDPRRERITIRQLLNFTSGLENNDSQLHSGRVKDGYAASIACRAKHEPGKRFRYGSNHLMVFGELLNRKLQAASSDGAPMPKDFVAYLKDRILKPIDCRVGRWLRDQQGNPALPFGAYLTAREWAKFGLLVLNRGKHGERQIVPSKCFDECLTGSKANKRYGLNFWLVGKQAHARDEAIPEDTFTAAGMFGQKLYIIPSEDLLIVRFGRTGNRKRIDDQRFLSRLFEQ